MTMTPEEEKELNKHLKAAAKILYKNTPPEDLRTFEEIENSLRRQILEKVGPEFASFFFQKHQELKRENPEK